MADYPDYAYILFDDICDIIGPSDEWPKRMLELFWSRDIKHWDHFVLSAFVVVNGLNPEIFLEWIDVIGLSKDENSLREFKSLPKKVLGGTEHMLIMYWITDLNLLVVK